MKMRRRSDGSIGDAYLYQGLFKPLPHWLSDSSKVRKHTAEKPMEVQIITGRWWAVHANDWIIKHGDDLWLIDDSDVNQTHEEI